MRVNVFAAAIVLGFTARVFAAGESAGGQVGISQGEGVLNVSVEGKPFTVYRYVEAKDDPKFLRPYFWPVLAGDGTEVTSDQWRLSQNQKTDHPHHRSIWVGWGDVNGYDHWTAKKWQQRHVGFTKVDADGFVEELTWDGATPAEPVLKETRTVKFTAYPDGARGIEIDSALTAANGDAVFKCQPLSGNSVEAGLIALRVAREISGDPKKQIVGAGGATGEKANREQTSAWCDYSGAINGKVYGLAIVSDAANPGGDFPWHVREQGLFAQIGPTEWTLPGGKTVTYRHLIIVHAGDAKAAEIEEKAKAWRLAK